MSLGIGVDVVGAECVVLLLLLLLLLLFLLLDGGARALHRRRKASGLARRRFLGTMRCMPRCRGSCW